MRNAIEEAQQTIAAHVDLSSRQLGATMNALHDITLQIGAFHRTRAAIYQKTFETMAGVTDIPTLLALQQEFIQSSMDNLLDHSKTMTELIARSATPDLTDTGGEDEGD